MINTNKDESHEEKPTRNKSRSRSRSKNRSKSKYRNSNINNKTQSPRAIYDTTPPHHDSNKSNYQMNSNQNISDLNWSPESVKNKGEAYYYFRRPPTHSSVTVNPEELMHGPPVHVAPYFYYTDKDLEVLNGEKDNRKVITTVSRQSDMFVGNSINKRVATSPLKS